MLSTATHVFSEIFIHLNWHCKDDYPYIAPQAEKPLYDFIEDYCNKTKGLQFFGIGGTENHVHLIIQIEPDVTISEWTGKIKGASAHEMNQNALRQMLNWQRGYGAVSFAKRDLKAVQKYVANQKEHHAKRTLNATLEKHSLRIKEEEETMENAD